MSWRTVVIIGSVSGTILGLIAYAYLSAVGSMLERDTSVLNSETSIVSSSDLKVSTERYNTSDLPYCDVLYYDNGIHYEVKLDVEVAKDFQLQPFGMGAEDDETPANIIQPTISKQVTAHAFFLQNATATLQ